MTGFRVSPGGAQGLWGIDPDLTCLGKVIGGGLPVGAYAGKREIMQQVAPAGPMYQAGTLSGNPLAMTAGLATLRQLRTEGVFDQIAARATTLAEGMRAIAEEVQIPLQVDNVGTMFGYYFLQGPGQQITNYSSARQYANTNRYAQYFWAMADRGIYVAPSQFEAGFVSLAHGDAEIRQTLDTFREALKSLM
jgi:glutamate-1-semialdehyde 2,1-aminomutase